MLKTCWEKFQENNDSYILLTGRICRALLCFQKHNFLIFIFWLQKKKSKNFHFGFFVLLISSHDIHMATYIIGVNHFQQLICQCELKIWIWRWVYLISKFQFQYSNSYWTFCTQTKEWEFPGFLGKEKKANRQFNQKNVTRRNDYFKDVPLRLWPLVATRDKQHHFNFYLSKIRNINVRCKTSKVTVDKFNIKFRHYHVLRCNQPLQLLQLISMI